MSAHSRAGAIDATAFNAFEAAGWELQAPGYDAFFGQVTSRLVDPLLDAAGARRGDRVLDVATGPGYAAVRAAERGAKVVGVDVAEAMVTIARERHPELEFRQADAHALPFAGETFDAVVANFLVLHLGRPERAASEFVRVLAPGGRLALTAWDVPDRARILGVVFDAVAAAGATAIADIPAGPDFFRFGHEDEFARLLRGAGLEDVEVETLAFAHPIASAEELWYALLGGTVRTSALIVHQAIDTRERIRAELDRLVNGYRTEDGLALPVSVKLAAGRKPLRGSPSCLRAIPTKGNTMQATTPTQLAARRFALPRDAAPGSGSALMEGLGGGCSLHASGPSRTRRLRARDSGG